jgi:hypothetical protein
MLIAHNNKQATYFFKASGVARFANVELNMIET